MPQSIFVPEYDFLPAARQRIIMLLGFITVIFFSPFTLISLWNGQVIAATFYFFIVISLFVNSYRIYYQHSVVIPSWIIYNVILLALVHSMSIRGVNALFWCYPAALGILVLSQRYYARINTVIFLSLLIPSAFYFVPTDIAARFAVTLLMMCVSSNIFVDIFSEFQNRLTELTIRDTLTKAFNRRHFIDCLEKAIATVQRSKQPITLVAFDLDHFKQVNDTYGHQVGDQVLIEVVNTVLERQRRTDSIFRLGGEEFVVLLPHTDLQSAYMFAEDIRQCIASAPLVEDAAVTISLGVAEYQPDESLDDWFKRADNNLYNAKTNGRNRICAGSQNAA